MKIKILDQARLKLAKMMGLNLSEITASDGTVLYFDGDTLDDGDSVYVRKEDGEMGLPPDGSYEAGGYVYLIEGGVVQSKVQANSQQDMQDAPDASDVPSPENGDTVPVESFNDLLKVTRELAVAVGELEEKVDLELKSHTSIQAKNTELEKKNIELEKQVKELDAKLSNALKTSKADAVPPTPSKEVKLSGTKETIINKLQNNFK